MEALLGSVYSNGSLLILWGAILFHLILPIPRSAHPIQLWRKFAQLLADKVNTPNGYSQQLLSGTLAWLLMCVPALILLIALRPLIWQPQLFDLALLLLAFDWRSQALLTQQIGTALTQEDKMRARALLSPLLNRETSTLSPLGLGKAAAETIIMDYARNVIGVLFWYALLGGTGALMYRLIIELARCWSPSRAQYQPFGQTSLKVAATLDWLPMKLFSLLLLAGRGFTGLIAQVRIQSLSWPQPGPGWLLCATGQKLQIALGGPAIYGGRKAIRAKIGGRIAPSALHLYQIQQLMASRMTAWIVLESLILTLINRGL